MEMNEQMLRDLKKKFEIESYKKEAEAIDYWKKEVDAIYKKKYDSLSSLQVDIRGLMERMGNRVNMLTRMAKEG
jgi:hypothetical protein